MVGGWVGCYDHLGCPASPKLLLGLDLGLGCDNDHELLGTGCQKSKH